MGNIYPCAKVAEIRQISGANVSINTEEEANDSGERVVVIKGRVAD